MTREQAKQVAALVTEWGFSAFAMRAPSPIYSGPKDRWSVRCACRNAQRNIFSEQDARSLKAADLFDPMTPFDSERAMVVWKARGPACHLPLTNGEERYLKHVAERDGCSTLYEAFQRILCQGRPVPGVDC